MRICFEIVFAFFIVMCLTACGASGNPSRNYIVRAHTSGAPADTTSGVMFTITKVSN